MSNECSKKYHISAIFLSHINNHLKGSAIPSARRYGEFEYFFKIKITPVVEIEQVFVCILFH